MLKYILYYSFLLFYIQNSVMSNEYLENAYLNRSNYKGKLYTFTVITTWLNIQNNEDLIFDKKSVSDVKFYFDDDNYILYSNSKYENHDDINTEKFYHWTGELYYQFHAGNTAVGSKYPNYLEVYKSNYNPFIRNSTQNKPVTLFECEFSGMYEPFINGIVPDFTFFRSQEYNLDFIDSQYYLKYFNLSNSESMLYKNYTYKNVDINLGNDFDRYYVKKYLIEYTKNGALYNETFDSNMDNGYPVNGSYFQEIHMDKSPDYDINITVIISLEWENMVVESIEDFNAFVENIYNNLNYKDTLNFTNQ